MAAPPSLTLSLLLIVSSLPLLLLILSLYFRRRCRQRPPSASGHHPAGAPLLTVPEGLPAPKGGVLADFGEVVEVEERGGEEKRRKKKGKKKRTEARVGSDAGEEDRAFERVPEGNVGKGGAGGAGCCPYPFSSFASATQRKIKLQYDQLVMSNQAKALTITQLGQFVSCLVEARNELQHKSEIIQRSFKIKKALLFKADRSSFDRLCQQIYKLEAEYKRLEEDATVYNVLQEQLKLSPAYKTMLEIGADRETKATTDETMEFPDISFEELLAQEKKDTFWQKYGKQRSCTS